MDTQRWQRVGDIFERLLGVPQAERAPALERLCEDDAQMRGIVMSMLDSVESPRFADATLATLRDRSQGEVDAILRAGRRDAETEGTRIGPWRLVRRIGAGGMGVVWLAERADGQFQQRAALKLIKRGMDSEAVLARFLRERQILARLEHRNIAHLLDGGIAPDGRPYFAMEYVEGLPLLRFADEHQLKLPDRLRLFLQVCAALRFAHAQHVVHRDIKPSNVLVTTDGSVKLLDFGIAKLLEGDAELTSTLTGTQREQPMTPAYAAPEQIAGGEISIATDVYALGCVFYELLTGRRPHDFADATDAHAVLEIILGTDPVAPGRLKLDSAPVPPKHLRGDLDTIALTALNPMPARRYADVGAFAADIEHYLAGRPIAARRDRLLYRGMKFLRRQRTGFIALAAVLGVVAIAVTVIVTMQQRGRLIVNDNAALAIVPFNNVAAKADLNWIGSAVGLMLATQLSQGSTMHPLADELVRESVVDVPAPAAGGYAAPALATLRKRLSADYVLSGGYVVTGTGDNAIVRLDLTMQDARNRDVVTVEQSGVMAELPELVGDAGAKLRARLGMPPLDDARGGHANPAQPPNLDVTRHFGLGLDALHHHDPAKARDELVATIARAPAFAPAYVYLAKAWKAMGFDARAQHYAQQAAEHKDGLPEDMQQRIDREVAVQTLDWPRAIDIDRKLLQASAQDPELHVDLFEDLLAANRFDEAATELAALRELPGSAADPGVELLAARLASSRGDQAGNAEHAEKALRVAESRDEKSLAAHARLQLAYARDALGQHQEAAALAQAAIDAFRDLKNPLEEGNAHLTLAIVRGHLDQPHDEVVQYQKALEILQRIGDRKQLATAYNNLSNSLATQGEMDAAVTAARNAQALQRELGNERDQSWSLSELAMLQREVAASDEVVAELREALALDERFASREHHIFVLSGLAGTLRVRGDLKQAAELCRQAQAENAQVKDAFEAMVVALDCAEIARDRGDLQAAMAGLADAAAKATAAGNTDTAVSAALHMATIEADRRQWAAARTRLEAAANRTGGGGELPVDAAVQALLALSCAVLQDDAASEQARTHALRLLAGTEKHLITFPAYVALEQLRGFRGERDAAAKSLVALADDAQSRQWVATALETRVAALALMDPASHEAQALRQQLAGDARQLGFAWVATRVAAGVTAPAARAGGSTSP